jgi:hypothetical protein
MPIQGSEGAVGESIVMTDVNWRKVSHLVLRKIQPHAVIDAGDGTDRNGDRWVDRPPPRIAQGDRERWIGRRGRGVALQVRYVAPWAVGRWSTSNAR